MIAILGIVIMALTGIAWVVTTVAGPFIGILGNAGDFIVQIAGTAWLLLPVGFFLFLWGTTKRPMISMLATAVLLIVLKFGLLGFTV